LEPVIFPQAQSLYHYPTIRDERLDSPKRLQNDYLEGQRL